MRLPKAQQTIDGINSIAGDAPYGAGEHDSCLRLGATSTAMLGLAAPTARGSRWF